MKPFAVGDQVVCTKPGDELNLREGETYTVYAVLRRAGGEPPGWAIQLVETYPHAGPDGVVYDSFDPRRFRRKDLPAELTSAVQAFAK